MKDQSNKKMLQFVKIKEPKSNFIFNCVKDRSYYSSELVKQKKYETNKHQGNIFY